MKVNFTTHSTSKYNELGFVSGWMDVPLSEPGIHQAKELGNVFANINLDLFCSSDLVGVVGTARIAFGKRVPVAIDNRLREINYGGLNDKPADLVAG
jgi:broad specificity phosphatase PhoE